jgi:hypothetical protein
MLGAFALGCLFLWLAYDKLAFFIEARKVRGGLTGLFNTVFWIVAFLFLTVSAWVGPIAYVVRIIRRQQRDDRPD